MRSEDESAELKMALKHDVASDALREIGHDTLEMDESVSEVVSGVDTCVPGSVVAEWIAARLEYLRGELQAERISQGELIELQGLAEHIEPGDVELLEAAGVPEFPEDRDRHQVAYTVYLLVPNDGGPAPSEIGAAFHKGFADVDGVDIEAITAKGQ